MIGKARAPELGRSECCRMAWSVGNSLLSQQGCAQFSCIDSLFDLYLCVVFIYVSTVYLFSSTHMQQLHSHMDTVSL